MAPLLTTLALGGLVWFTLAALAAREALIAAARRACADLNVQLLDDTVAITRLGIARDGAGRVRFARTYAFDFSVNGSDRLRASAYLIGAQVQHLRFDFPQGAVLIPGRSPPRAIY